MSWQSQARLDGQYRAESRLDDDRGDPTVLSSFTERSPEPSDPSWVRFEGRGNERAGQGRWATLDHVLTPSLTLKAFSGSPRDFRTLQCLMNYIPLLSLPTSRAWCGRFRGSRSVVKLLALQTYLY